MSVMQRLTRALSVWMAILMLGAAAQAQGLPPGFSKVFTPDTVGPGATSTLTFTINNSDSSLPADNLDFTDVLPAGSSIAGRASTDCNAATLSAPVGGTTISLSGGTLGAGAVCSVSVEIEAPAAAGTTTNISGALTSSLGNSGKATDDLTVATTLPGFRKSFAPSSINLGARSTLTYTIDNSANPSGVSNLDFTETLPVGLQIASPSNAVTDCGTTILPSTVAAPAGGNQVVLDANGFTPTFPAVPTGGTCTVSVDVIGIGNGTQTAVSGDLLANFVAAGRSVASIDVTAAPLNIAKTFLTNPANSGGTTALEFTIDNFNRTEAATDVAFTDDLNAALTRLTFDSLVSNTCGGSVAGTGTTTLTLSGGTIAAEGQCKIRVTLSVPSGAVEGTYTNTTSAVTATVGGVSVTGNAASADLFIPPGGSAPTLTFEILEAGTLAADPVISAGDDIVLRYTITNTSATSPATDVALLHDLIPPLSYPVSVALPPTPNPPCGAASSLALVTLAADDQGLQLTGGALAVSGSPGDSCTFDVTLTTPSDLTGGTYSLTTEDVTATLGGGTATGTSGSDSFDVNAGVSLSFVKSFSGVAQPGETVDLTFEIQSGAESFDTATALAFTDDLGAALPGLTAGAPTTNTCNGTMGRSAGDTLLTYSGGSLAPAATCTITVPVTVPAGAAVGTYTNTTSTLSASASGQTFTLPAVSADLTVSAVFFTKEFLPDTVIAGQETTLRYTIENTSTVSANLTLFTDNLNGAISGLAATGPATTDTCGGSLSGATNLVYSGGSVAAGQTCIIEAPLLVPAGAADGTYPSLSSALGTSLGTIDPAVASLTVNSGVLLLEKSFARDTVRPGETVEISVSVTNAGSAPVSNVSYTDDVDAMLAGTVLTGLPSSSGTCPTLDLSSAVISVADVGFLGDLGAGDTCTVSFSVSIPSGAAPGTYTNTTSDVTGTVSGLAVSGAPASADLIVTDTDVTFAKSFAGPVGAGSSTTMQFDITNSGSSVVSGIGFTDDLDAMLSGAAASNLSAGAGCGGAALSGTSLLAFSGGSIDPGATCTLTATVTAPAGATPGSYTNTTSQLFSSGIPVAPAAEDALEVVPPPAFAKVFAPAGIAASQSTTLTFTIDNTASPIAATALDFIDNLPAAVQVASPSNAATTCAGGTITATAGDGTVDYSGGTVGAGATCTVSVDVTATAVGAHVNTSGDLTSSSGNSGAASDTLTVVPLPGFSKAFSDGAVLLGGTTQLTFTVDNTGSVLDASGLDFTDNLPAGIAVATPSNASTTCTGGTLTAVDGSASISYSGGTATAGASCNVTVDVTGTGLGAHLNVSGDLTSSLGSSGAATDSLTVVTPEIDVEGDIGGAVAVNGTLPQGDQPATVQQTLNVTITNNGTSDLTLSTPVISGVSNVTVDSVQALPLTTLGVAASTSFEVLYTPSAAGAFSFDVSISNNDVDENPYVFTVGGNGLDVAAPEGYSATFDQDPVNAAGQIGVSFTFAGAEVGATYDYTITSDGGGTDVAGTGTIATATDQISGIDVSGLGDGTLTLTVTLTDAAGNTGADATDTTTKDAVGPTATLDGPALPQAYSFTVDLTFSKDVFGLALTSLEIDNGTASVLTGSGDSYSFTVTPDHDGPIEISLLAGAATDAAGNPSAAAGPIEVLAALTGTPNPNPPPDADGDGIPDFLESFVADRDGDGIPDAEDFDPQGYFYCEDDGRIIPGGSFSVSGPFGSNSSLGTQNFINITRDGSTGEIQWFAQVPGTYSVSLTYPTVVGIPSTSRLDSGLLDMTTLLPSNPAVLGSTEVGSTGFLADGSLAANSVYYTSFDIQPGDPFVLANNIPMTQCADNPVVVSASTNGAEANGGTPTDASFTVSQDRESTQDTVVSYTVAGTATSGTDFTALSGTVTIPAGATSATIPVPVLEDSEIEGPETIQITLTAVTTGDLTTQLGATVTGTATIADDDFAQIAVTDVDLVTNEGGGDDAMMTFVLLGTPTAPVTLSFAGDSQCSVSPATLTFTAANYTVPQALTIRARDDDKVEGPHSCQPTATVGSADTAFDGLPLPLSTVTVTDDLVDQVREPLTQILEDDLAQTIGTQARAFGRIAKGALARLQAGPELPCGTLDAFDVDGSLQIKDATGTASGKFGSDVYNCATESREIVDGSFSLTRTEDTGLQALLQVAFQRERFVSDSEIAGYFMGGYFSRTEVSELGDGTIHGFGVNGGLYGARGFGEGLFLDYYMAGAAGRHRYDIAFDAASAPIATRGDYDYLAGFAGLGVSGQREFERVIMRPRVAIDLSYARAGDADVTASQLGLTHTGTIDLDDFSGARATAEIAFESLAAPGGSEALSAMMRTVVTPRLSCTLSSYEDSADCGLGLSLAWERTDAASGLSYGFEVDVEKIDETRRLTLNFTRERPFAGGQGAVVTRLSMPPAQTWQVEHGVRLDF